MPLQSSHYDALCRLGFILFDRGHTERALRVFLGITSISPQKIYGWRLLGACHHRLGELGPGADAYRRALSIDQRDLATRIAFAELLRDQGHLPEAIALLRHLPQSPQDQLISYAQALRTRWQLATSKPPCEHAARLKPPPTSLPL